MAGVKPILHRDQFQYKAVAQPVLSAELCCGEALPEPDIRWWWPFEACALTGAIQKIRPLRSFRMKNPTYLKALDWVG